MILSIVIKIQDIFPSRFANLINKKKKKKKKKQQKKNKQTKKKTRVNVLVCLSDLQISREIFPVFNSECINIYVF